MSIGNIEMQPSDSCRWGPRMHQSDSEIYQDPWANGVGNQIRRSGFEEARTLPEERENFPFFQSPEHQHYFFLQQFFMYIWHLKADQIFSPGQQEMEIFTGVLSVLVEEAKFTLIERLDYRCLMSSQDSSDSVGTYAGMALENNLWGN